MTSAFHRGSRENERSPSSPISGTPSALSYAPGTNRLISSPRGTYSYNAAGNPVSDGYFSFGCDDFGHLTSRGPE
jgi:hypothetical protein